jgi:hypothetical protein
MVLLEPDCKTFQYAAMTFWWIDGHLVDNATALSSKHPLDVPMVKIFLKKFDDVAKSSRQSELWRYEGPIRHSKYPLEMYPKAFWSTPASAPPAPPKDVLWGILNTADPLTNRPFLTMCNIVRPDATNPLSAIDGSFARTGDAKCRGELHVVAKDLYIGGMTDIYAQGAPEIDQIMNAVVRRVEQLVKAK